MNKLKKYSIFLNIFYLMLFLGIIVFHYFGKAENLFFSIGPTIEPLYLTYPVYIVLDSVTLFLSFVSLIVVCKKRTTLTKIFSLIFAFLLMLLSISIIVLSPVLDTVFDLDRGIGIPWALPFSLAIVCTIVGFINIIVLMKYLVSEYKENHKKDVTMRKKDNSIAVKNTCQKNANEYPGALVVLNHFGGDLVLYKDFIVGYKNIFPFIKKGRSKFVFFLEDIDQISYKATGWFPGFIHWSTTYKTTRKGFIYPPFLPWKGYIQIGRYIEEIYDYMFDYILKKKGIEIKDSQNLNEK